MGTPINNVDTGQGNDLDAIAARLRELEHFHRQRTEELVRFTARVGLLEQLAIDALTIFWDRLPPRIRETFTAYQKARNFTGSANFTVSDGLRRAMSIMRRDTPTAFPPPLPVTVPKMTELVSRMQAPPVSTVTPATPTK